MAEAFVPGFARQLLTMYDQERFTALLNQLDLADPGQSDELLELVYDDLKEVAARQLSRESNANTLQPTSLVNEAYMRLVESAPVNWNGRTHFLAILARAMRQVLVDHARRRNAEKRGGDREHTTLDSRIIDDHESNVEILDLHRALEKLSGLDAILGRLVELRFFGGLTVDETAEVLGVSPRKAAKDWAAARLWLGRELATG
jgi:RNA polymerase sigma factor (TIGR02999 family)